MTKERYDELVKIHLKAIEKRWRAEIPVDTEEMVFVEMAYHSECKHLAHLLDRMQSLLYKKNKRRK